MLASYAKWNPSNSVYVGIMKDLHNIAVNNEVTLDQVYQTIDLENMDESLMEWKMKVIELRMKLTTGVGKRKKWSECNKFS